MKALSIHPEYAMNIIKGLKTIEVRSWTTKYRGEILICSTAKKGRGLIDGHALGVVTLSDVLPMKREYARSAMVSSYENWTGYYAWILKNPRPIVPFPMKGKLSLWECSHEVEYLSAPKEKASLRNYCEKYWDGFLRGEFFSVKNGQDLNSTFSTNEKNPHPLKDGDAGKSKTKNSKIYKDHGSERFQDNKKTKTEKLSKHKLI